MADSGRARTLVCFGPFEADLHAGELRKLGVRLRLREKSFDLLAILLEHPSEVVSREALRTRLWPADVFVDFDNNLNTAVARLREVLGDCAEKPRYVETLPRRGYRFIQPVSIKDRLRKELDTNHFRLAVLPFDNLSGNLEQEYFSDGMTEELITELARVAPERLTVIARTSAMRYKGSRKPIVRIGRELDSAYIVEGSVRRADNRIRVSAQLIQVDGQKCLWAQSYDGELQNALQLQSDIARAIARQIDANLAPGPTHVSPVNVRAYDAYLLGLHQFSRACPSGFEKAIEHFRSAIEEDPRFAPAYAKTAMSHAIRAYFGYAPYADALPKAETAARNAIELDDHLSEAHIALAVVRWFHQWDVGECCRELMRAVELGPNDPAAHWGMALFQAAMKQDHQRAAVEAEMALSLDPLSVLVRSTICWLPYWARRYDEAIAQGQKTLQLDENAVQALYVIGAAARATGDFGTAVSTLEHAVAKFGDPLSLAYLGMTYGISGRLDLAQSIFLRLAERCAPHRVPSVLLAFVYVGLGEKQKALEHIEKAFDERDAFTLWLRVSPDWDPLRGEPHFQQLLLRLDRAVHLPV